MWHLLSQLQPIATGLQSIQLLFQYLKLNNKQIALVLIVCFRQRK